MENTNSEIPKYVLSIISKVPGTNTSAPVGPSSVWNLPDGTIRVARYATIIMITKMTYICGKTNFFFPILPVSFLIIYTPIIKLKLPDVLSFLKQFEYVRLHHISLLLHRM